MIIAYGFHNKYCICQGTLFSFYKFITVINMQHLKLTFCHIIHHSYDVNVL